MLDGPASNEVVGSGGTNNATLGAGGSSGQPIGSGGSAVGGAGSTTGSGTGAGAGGAGTSSGVAGSSVTVGAGGSSGATGSGGAGGSSGPGGADGGSGCTVEVCDGLDNDCSGTPDDGNVCGVGCEGATYGGHAYAFCDGPLNWQGAVTDCGTKSMRLVRIDDVAQQAWVRSLAYKNAGTNNPSAVWRWLGASDIAVDGEWRWSDGTQFWQGAQNGSQVGGLYTNWAQGQPSSQDDCAAMQNQPSSVWDAMPCTLVQPFVCELY